MEELLARFFDVLVKSGIIPVENAQATYDSLLQSEYLEHNFDATSGLLLGTIFNEIDYLTHQAGIPTPLFTSQDRLFENQHLALLEEKLLLEDTIEITFTPEEPSVLTLMHTDTAKINYNMNLSDGVSISFAINAINKLLMRERYLAEITELVDNRVNFLAYIVTTVGEGDRIRADLAPFFVEGELTNYQGQIDEELHPLQLL